MNTQTGVYHLQAGQALQLEAAERSGAVLTEGELLVQPPAQWLAGMVVVPAPLRLRAPAAVPADASWSIVAVRACAVAVQQPARALPGAWLAARVAGLLRLAR